jgi:hypothetical protein
MGGETSQRYLNNPSEAWEKSKPGGLGLGVNGRCERKVENFKMRRKGLESAVLGNTNFCSFNGRS